jgi:hypothetical protein
MTVIEPELITIVEGPPPDFYLAREFWPFSLWEGDLPQAVALAQMRTLNGPAMLERCTRAWSQARSVLLDFPQLDGLRRKAEVLAARLTTIEEGDVLNLWVALPTDQIANAAADRGADDDDAVDGDGFEANF